MKLTLKFFGLLAIATLAHASTITFVLDQDGCTGTCGTGPYATVSLTDMGSGTASYVMVTETLSAGEVFARSSGKEALEFNVQVSAGTVAITNISNPTKFGAARGSAGAPPFGSFYSAVTCLKCSGGNPGNPAGPLTFDVSDSLTGVTTADFVANNSGYYFASDIRGANGKTGDVAALLVPGTTEPLNTLAPTATPEPGSLLMMLGGVLIMIAGRAFRTGTSAVLSKAIQKL